jgi:phosphohistidine phosphatase SixA
MNLFSGKFTRREMFAAWAGLCVMALVPRFLSGEALAQGSPEELVAAMREGGKVIFLRHAATNADEIDTGVIGNRAGQRNLSEAGILQARQLGDTFRASGITLSGILASPVFRARDTGELAFGADNIEVTMDIVADDYAGRHLQTMVEATRAHLSTPPEAGTNLLLIGHRTPLQMVTGQSFPDTTLPEGAMAVFQPNGTDATLLGTLTAEEFAAAIAP